MKNYLLLIFLLLFIGCTSNEEKANKFLNDYLSKAIINPETYVPIETNISEAYKTPYTDTIFITNVEKIIGLENELESNDQRLKILTNAANVPMWSDIQTALHYELLPELENHPLKDQIIDVAEHSDNLRREIDSLQLRLSIGLPYSKEKLGWKIIHKFKHKDNSGNDRIEEIYMVVDNEFKNVILLGDMNNPYFQEIIEYIKKNYDTSNQ